MDMQKVIRRAGFIAISIGAVIFLGCLQNASHAENIPAAESFPQVIELTLTEAVMMALRHNRSLESAYMDRVLARFDLRRDLTEFHPDLAVTVGAETDISRATTKYKGNELPDRSVSKRSPGAFATTRVTQKIPTGAELAFVWDNRARSTRESALGNTIRAEPRNTGWKVELRQPLLKDAGWEYNTASVEIARMEEEDAVRLLRDRVIGTVTSVVENYRNLLQQYQEMDMQRASLSQALEQLELTRVLIATGRRAPNEILQAEANVARQELALEGAKSRLDSAQLALLNLLNIGRGITIIPTEQIQYRTVDPDIDACLQIAFDRNADYLRALNRKKIAQLAVMRAENQRLWDLSFNVGYGQGWNRDRHDPNPDFNRNEWNLGLTLSVPLPIYGEAKYARERPLLSARIGLRKASMDILTIEENLENQIRTAVRRVESAHKQVELAQHTRQLSERSFEVSGLEYKLGRISSMDHIRNQDKLREDRENEIRAIISYENALSALDQLLATTLETWEIEFIPNREDLEEEFLGRRTWMLGER